MTTKNRKKALRSISNGLFIMTARLEDKVGAATVSWVTQVSFRPQLLLVAVRHNSNIYDCLKGGGVGALHVLTQKDQSLAQKFFRPTDANESTINGEQWKAGASGAPLLKAVPVTIEFQTRRRIDVEGDHDLFVLEVLDAHHEDVGSPLTVFDSPWEYGG